MTDQLAREAEPDLSDEVALRAVDVGVHFGGLYALQDVSLTVPKGTIVGLVGPNGAGKTTFLNVLSGFLRPQRGRVEFLGRDITRLQAEDRARLGLTRTFQHPELFEALTVSEHLLLGLRMGHARSRLVTDLFGVAGWQSVNSSERERVDGLVELLGLQAVADRECVALPSGLARLVEVGRAIAMGPRVLLLDEPAAGLDNRESDELFWCLKRVSSAEGVSLVLVEHDLDFVVRLCDIVDVLDAGLLIASGTPTEIQNDPLVQEAYLGAETLTEEHSVD